MTILSKTLVSRAIDGAIKGKASLQIGAGMALRNYICVKDDAQAIVFALKKKLDGIHLLAGHEAMPVHAMPQKICEIFIPGSTPLSKEGGAATDQIIERSAVAPKTRTFREALIDIRRESQQ